MTPHATRFLSATAIAALMLGATAAWACDHGARSASGASCPAKGSSVTAAKAKPAAAARVAAAPKKAEATAKKASPSQAGMRAYIDPETGALTSFPGINGIGPDGLPGGGSTVVLTEVPLPRGGYMVDLQGTLEDYAVLRIDSKGRRMMACTPDPRAALKATPVAPTPTSFPEK